MTDRLDRIEAILETTAQQQAKTDKKIDTIFKATEQQQAKTADEIDTLLGAVSTNEAAVHDLTVNVNNLLGESKDSQKRFEILRDEATADRLETRQLWNDTVSQMQTDRDKAEAARKEDSRRFDAQQEVIQRLLIELVEMNRDNRRLRDRFDNLEQAS